jgi:hypothetical protein
MSRPPKQKIRYPIKKSYESKNKGANVLFGAEKWSKNMVMLKIEKLKSKSDEAENLVLTVF